MDVPGRLRALAGIHTHLNKDAQDLLMEAASLIESLEKNNPGMTKRYLGYEEIDGN